MDFGRPPIFETPAEMQTAIDLYFAEQDRREKPYTVVGLARHIGMTRHSLNNYEKNDRFFTTVKAAKLRVEERLEERLAEGAPAGTIFNLKNNFAWKDQTEQTVEHKGGLNMWTGQPKE